MTLPNPLMYCVYLYTDPVFTQYHMEFHIVLHFLNYPESRSFTIYCKRPVLDSSTVKHLVILISVDHFIIQSIKQDNCRTEWSHLEHIAKNQSTFFFFVLRHRKRTVGLVGKQKLKRTIRCAYKSSKHDICASPNLIYINIDTQTSTI